MHLHSRRGRVAFLRLLCQGLALGACWLLATGGLAAQSGGSSRPKPTPDSKSRPPARTDFQLSVDVDLVVLHTTVVDLEGRIVSELKQENFRVYEDNLRQEVSIFRQEDIPITVGLVIDNSASMRPTKEAVKAAALTFVETSNRADEVFVVNFNDDYYLDLGPGRDFSNDLIELRDALDKTDTRGGTALWDALRASLDHLKRGTRQKKVLLVISDGVDRYSNYRYEELVRYAQQRESAIYVVMLETDEEARDIKKARRQLRKLASLTGGEIYFPFSIEEVQSICKKIAHNIRNQYILAYYPTNRVRDGSFRSVRVEVRAPKGQGRFTARTRTGYYAPGSERTGSNGP